MTESNGSTPSHAAPDNHQLASSNYGLLGRSYKPLAVVALIVLIVAVAVYFVYARSNLSTPTYGGTSGNLTKYPTYNITYVAAQSVKAASVNFLTPGVTDLSINSVTPLNFNVTPGTEINVTVSVTNIVNSTQKLLYVASNDSGFSVLGPTPSLPINLSAGQQQSFIIPVRANSPFLGTFWLIFHLGT